MASSKARGNNGIPPDLIKHCKATLQLPLYEVLCHYWPLYIALIDLTKAFDLVGRDGLFKVLPKIGCPPKLPSMIESFHNDMKGTVQFNGSCSEPPEIRSDVKQGGSNAHWDCLRPIGKTCLRHTTEGIYLRTQSDGSFFNHCRLRAKTKVRKVLTRDMLFADDAAVATHTKEELQSLMDCFSQACKDFGLTISLKKTNVLGQDTEAPPVITIDDYELYAPSLTTSHRTQRSTRGLGRQLHLSVVSRLECGQAPS